MPHGLEIPNGISFLGKFFDLEDNWNVKQIFFGKR